MLRIDPDPSANAKTALAAPAPRSQRKKSPSPQSAANLPEMHGFPRWARSGEAAVRTCDAAFFAGASLALLDQSLAAAPLFAGALRQRLALRAATACAALARRREDAGGLRDAEDLNPGAGPTSPAGRMHHG